MNGTKHTEHGQAMIEYVIIMGLLLASLTVLALFRQTFSEYGDRATATVSSDYP